MLSDAVISLTQIFKELSTVNKLLDRLIRNLVSEKDERLTVFLSLGLYRLWIKLCQERRTSSIHY